MFRLLKECKYIMRLQHTFCWYDRSQTGCKPTLKEDTVDPLVENYHSKTTGGNSISKTSLSTGLNELIWKEYVEKIKNTRVR